MGRIITVFFKGVNGVGSFNLPINPGQFGARILTVQRIAQSLSSSPVLMAQDMTSSVPFGPEVGSTGTVSQTGGNDYSDDLFMANVELL